LGTKQGDLKLAFSTSVDNESKILINRNIRERAKKALPYLMYDENPYTVIDNNGDIYWVLDAYTASSEYPYSTYTEIEYEGEKQKINYIRNSVKVIINAYDGTMKFYITDRTDPIAIAYNKLYPNLFEDKESEIPEDISSKFIYPKFLYDVQAKMLEVYHNVKPEVLYRSNDLWEFATYNTNQTNKTVGTILESYYTMLKTTDSDTEKLGLVQMYTKDGKSNITSYLVGECEGINTKLSIYKFSTDTNLLGPTQLDKQIEQDETISKQLNSLNITGSRISKKIIIVPIENTLLYIEPIYQTMINESNVPSLKKVIVASGTKMAIGDNIIEALENLLSQYALNIQIDRTDDIEGMIKSIIEANNNLKASSESHNWEIMGRDIQELQELIDILEKLIDEKEKNNETKSTEQVDSLENK
ncbi:MAG: COG1615 family transporter, partial [Clostridia bacterium]|nr:COG1615 family transporter [Clostridia bacterium]